MADGQGLGTLLFTTPLPRFRIWNLVFLFSLQGPLYVFRFSLRSPRSSCLYVFLLF